jgi:hypothetical protein
MPSLDVFSSSPATTTVQIESEPPGAEARTSGGQTCRTPCALAVPMADFTVTYTLTGYQPQTVPVKFAAPDRSIDSELGSAPPPVVDPNPVYAELQPAAPPRRPQQRQPRPRAQSASPAPARAASSPAAPPPPPDAATAAPPPASPWPPVPR